MQELRTGDRAFIRELNTSIVLDCIRKREPVSRAEIARITGLGRSTVSGIVAALQESGLVVSAGTAPSTGGRKPDLLALAENAFFAVGIKIEPQHVRAALTDLRGAVIAESVTSLHG
ncbi:MAG: MarR family transcriptional regulator, partial [Firmicutes bacterium]|nr:MarR family transcriptional regulator [Bacillota bacterium]